MKKIDFQFLKWLSAKEKKLTISTFLTVIRIGLTPFIIGAIFLHVWGIASICFISAAITDILDGNIARWRNEQTILGAMLDPLADKFLILSCFFAFALVESPFLGVPLWLFGVVCVKELILLAGICTIYTVKIQGNFYVKPIFLGKVTTVVQMFFIAWLLFCYYLKWFSLKTYYIIISVMLVLVIASFLQYCVIGVRWLSKDI